ncbi:MAG: type II secretion system F family protein [Actinomycetota bacterium]|nr:type II secretion system F family protein [Actinomycetota bacterium]
MSTTILLIGFGCIFAGMFVVFASIGGLTKEVSGVGRSISVLEALVTAPEQMRSELDPLFVDRVLAPLLTRIQGMSRRLTASDATSRMRSKLDQAGNPAGLTPDRVNGLKVICFVGALVVSLLLALGMGLGLAAALPFVMIASVVGYMAPNLFLYQRAYNRTDLLRRALPDAIDLLTISVESGLGFDAALSQVARNTEGPLAEEFQRMMQEMQIGRGRSDALRSMAERTNLPDLRAFVSAMVQADAFGIPIGQVLRVQSSEIRLKRRQWAEEQAQKVPVKILVPLIFCILPCLFIAVLGPAAISIFSSFKGTLN